MKIRRDYFNLENELLDASDNICASESMQNDLSDLDTPEFEDLLEWFKENPGALKEEYRQCV